MDRNEGSVDGCTLKISDVITIPLPLFVAGHKYRLSIILNFELSLGQFSVQQIDDIFSYFS